MAHFTGSIPRSLHIFFASPSSISLRLGTEERLFRLGFPHQECRRPSLMSSQPCACKVLQQFGFLHSDMAILSSSYSVPADAMASSRLNSMASWRVTQRLSTSSFRLRSGNSPLVLPLSILSTNRLVALLSQYTGRPCCAPPTSWIIS